MRVTFVARFLLALSASGLLSVAVSGRATAQGPSSAPTLQNPSFTRIGPIGYTPFADSAPSIKHASTKCGPRRLCAQGWDLVAVDVEAPGKVIPAGETVGFRVTLANAGRVASPETPMRFSVDEKSAYSTIPALEPGDTLTFVMPIRVENTSTYQKAVLTVDPDKLSGEQNSQNNTADFDEFDVELEHQVNVEIADVTFEPEMVRAGRPVEVRVTVRNRNRAHPLTDAVLVVDKKDWAGTKDASSRIMLPAIPPQTELTGVVTLQGFTALDSKPDEPLTAGVWFRVISGGGDQVALHEDFYKIKP